jgi:transcriptional regulator with XRE-family HTH domain
LNYKSKIMIQERILQIMTNYGLNAGQFADKLGVQPSSISHILSGRNKPSLDFVTKLLNCFPQIDYMWLVMGKGSMFKINDESEKLINNNEKSKEDNEKQTNSPELSLFSQDNNNAKPSEISKIEDNDINVGEKTLYNVKKTENNSTKDKFSIQNTINKDDKTLKKEIEEKKIENIEKENSLQRKTVEKIIVFYTDNTFDELIKK